MFAWVTILIIPWLKKCSICLPRSGRKKFNAGWKKRLNHGPSCVWPGGDRIHACYTWVREPPYTAIQRNASTMYTLPLLRGCSSLFSAKRPEKTIHLHISLSTYLSFSECCGINRGPMWGLNWAWIRTYNNKGGEIIKGPTLRISRHQVWGRGRWDRWVFTPSFFLDLKKYTKTETDNFFTI